MARQRESDRPAKVSAKQPKGTASSYGVRSYTGSPDSEVVASYVEHFIYDVGRTAEIRQKYAIMLKENIGGNKKKGLSR